MNFKKLREMITVKGNGNPVLKQVEVSSFLHLHLSVDAHIELRQSNEEKVVIETDDNLVDYIGITNSGKTLFITPEGGYRKLQFSDLRIQVFFRQITRLYVSFDKGLVYTPEVISLPESLEAKFQGSGAVNLAIDVPVFKATLQHIGDVCLRGHCNEAYIKTQSEGNLFAKDLEARHLTIKNMSEGNIEAFASDTISIWQYGVGFIHYWGNATLISMSQRGSGLVKHKAG